MKQKIEDCKFTANLVDGFKKELQCITLDNSELIRENKNLKEIIKELQDKVAKLKERIELFEVVPPTSRIDFALFNNGNFKRMEKNLIITEMLDAVRDGTS